MLRIPLECFESRSNGWSWHSNASNPVRMVGIGIRTPRMPFKWLKLAFECFESRWNASNPVRMDGVGIQTPRIRFEWLELAFERFESSSNGWNWLSNASNPNPVVA